MQLEMIVLLKDDAGKPLAVGQLQCGLREMLDAYLGPRMASMPDAWSYLTSLPLPDLSTAPNPHMVSTFLEPKTAPLPEPEAPASRPPAVEPPLGDPLGVSADPVPDPPAPNAAAGPVCYVELPGSPLHRARVRVLGPLQSGGQDVAGAMRCEILDGPHAGGTTTADVDQLIPE